ncbi:hypothetical protein A3F37_00730 [Candidatus Saccharibacteria bacterium RIFCSPHIGHO2_12_FULL_41_12]|nr:MAG: hypothetical protein A3F37_00730 [Candidatus Saccharibacteria bacterium RIFCSPHIGHO2_12_FULL_41_12]
MTGERGFETSGGSAPAEIQPANGRTVHELYQRILELEPKEAGVAEVFLIPGDDRRLVLDETTERTQHLVNAPAAITLIDSEQNETRYVITPMWRSKVISRKSVSPDGESQTQRIDETPVSEEEAQGLLELIENAEIQPVTQETMQALCEFARGELTGEGVIDGGSFRNRQYKQSTGGVWSVTEWSDLPLTEGSKKQILISQSGLCVGTDDGEKPKHRYVSYAITPDPERDGRLEMNRRTIADFGAYSNAGGPPALREDSPVSEREARKLLAAVATAEQEAVKGERLVIVNLKTGRFVF